MKRSSLEKRIGWQAELICVEGGRLPATSKVSLLIRGVRFAAKANTEGSFAASAVGGVLALVSVTLGQQHLYPLPWGFSLGGLGFFGLRKIQLRGSVCIKDACSLLLGLVYMLGFFGVLVLRHLSAFPERARYLLHV